MKNWVPIVPWFLPPLLTYKESQAGKHTNNGKTPQIYFFSKKTREERGEGASIEHKQMRRRRQKQKRNKLRERGDERYSLSSGGQKTKNPITRMMRGNQAWGVRSDAHFDYAVLHHIVVLHFG
jgi:hypothetical protein